MCKRNVKHENIQVNMCRYMIVEYNYQRWIATELTFAPDPLPTSVSPETCECWAVARETSHPWEDRLRATPWRTLKSHVILKRTVRVHVCSCNCGRSCKPLVSPWVSRGGAGDTCGLNVGTSDFSTTNKLHYCTIINSSQCCVLRSDRAWLRM